MSKKKSIAFFQKELSELFLKESNALFGAYRHALVLR